MRVCCHPHLGFSPHGSDRKFQMKLQMKFHAKLQIRDWISARTSGWPRAKRKRKTSFVRGVTSESEGASTKNPRVDSWVGVEFQGVFDIQNEPTCLVQKIIFWNFGKNLNFKIFWNFRKNDFEVRQLEPTGSIVRLEPKIKVCLNIQNEPTCLVQKIEFQNFHVVRYRQQTSNIRSGVPPRVQSSTNTHGRVYLCTARA